jgi:hypothetical protein
MPLESNHHPDTEADKRVFNVRDCTLIAVATGQSALTLKELLDGIHHVPASCLYHHFWGGLLQPRFEEREYNNDFSAWVKHGLHDGELAERLAVVDPASFKTLEDLRWELCELIEERMDESERLSFQVATRSFEFIQSKIVVFDTRTRIADPAALGPAIAFCSAGTIFYHFIDARRRSPDEIDDFSAWLFSFGDQYNDLIGQIAGIDPYFSSLLELRQRLSTLLTQHFEGSPS